MTDPTFETETELALIDGALLDLGTLHRRVSAETLSEADFRTLTGRLRARLKALRAARLASDEPAIVLTDAGMATAVVMAAAGAVGQRPEVAALMRRIPALMTAQQLAGNPAVRRARFYGPFAAVDGGRT